MALCLENWFIALVTKKDKNIGFCVKGTNSQGTEWRSSAIEKVIRPTQVVTLSGCEYLLKDTFQEILALENGVPSIIAKQFRKGFPSNWAQLLSELQTAMDKTKLSTSRIRRRPDRYGMQDNLSLSRDDESGGDGDEDGFEEIARRKKLKVEPEDEDGWTLTEVTSLGIALGRADPTALNYWEDVAHVVESRTAQECQAKQANQFRCAQQEAKIKAPQVEVEITEIRGKVGTIARKQDLRRLLQFSERGYADDYLASTPAQIKLGSFRLFDVESPHLPEIGPVTPIPLASTAESPGLLKPVNRDDLDGYINKIKGITRVANREKGKEDKKTALKESNNRIVAESPKQLAQRVAQLTKLKRSSRVEDEEAEGYYFSEGSESGSF